MKKLGIFIALIGIVFCAQAQTKKKTSAQTTTATKPAPKTATKPSVVGVPKDRVEVSPPINPEKWREGKTMQQLYDELHGADKKPADTEIINPAITTKPAAAPIDDTKAIAQNMNALKPNGRRCAVGLRGGAGLGTTAGAGLSESSMGAAMGYNAGFHAGVVLSIGISRVLSIQPEVLYTQNGAKFTRAINGTEFVFRTRQNVVQVPMLLKASFGGRTQMYVEAGGFGSYALFVQTSTMAGGQSQQSTTEYTGSAGRFEFGAVGGLGVSLPVGKNKLQIGGRFTRGLANNATQNASTYTQNIIATAALLIPLGR